VEFAGHQVEVVLDDGEARNSVVVSAFDEYGAALAAARAGLDSDVAAEIPAGFMALERGAPLELDALGLGRELLSAQVLSRRPGATGARERI